MYDESAIEVYTTASGLQRYRLPAVFPQSNKHRNISSDTPLFAVHKAAMQEMYWMRQWEARSAFKHKKLGLEMNAKRKDLKTRQKERIAEGRTELAQQELSSAYKILENALQNPLNYDWGAFKSFPPFPVEKPAPPEMPAPPIKPGLPREPYPDDVTFLPKLEAIDKLRRSKREQKEQEARQRFESAHKQWEQVCRRVMHLYHAQINQYKNHVQEMRAQYQQQFQLWEAEKERYNRERMQCLQIIQRKEAAYLEHEPHAVLDFFDMALSFSDYPVCYPQSYELDYDAHNRILLLDYLMPPLRVMPRLAKVTYDETTDSFHDILLTDDERNGLYARVLHEIPLRTLHELFTLDTSVALASIHFRGYLFLQENAAPGTPPLRILTLKVDRGIFAALDLYHNDPTVVFEELGGVIKPLE